MGITHPTTPYHIPEDLNPHVTTFHNKFSAHSFYGKYSCLCQLSKLLYQFLDYHCTGLVCSQGSSCGTCDEQGDIRTRFSLSMSVFSLPISFNQCSTFNCQPNNRTISGYRTTHSSLITPVSAIKQPEKNYKYHLKDIPSHTLHYLLQYLKQKENQGVSSKLSLQIQKFLHMRQKNKLHL